MNDATALKVKLMVRRPITTLVAQGILPSPKTSPALYEQRQKLERAKMGDMLRAKIARRPDRAELVHRHILEDVRPGVDPSLCDKQRQLKRAKLADTLSNQLQARPGPLELVAKNILRVTEDVTVIDGIKDQPSTHRVIHTEYEHTLKPDDAEKIPLPEFTPTNQGLPTCQVAVPNKYSVDEDSSSDISGILSPQNDVFSSISDSPRGLCDGTAPSTPNSLCQSQQMSPSMFTETTNLTTSKSIKNILSSSSVTKSESHDTIFSSFCDPTSTSSKNSQQAAPSIFQFEDSTGIKQHKRRSSATDASVFVAPSPLTTIGTSNIGTQRGRSSSSKSPSPSPSANLNVSSRPGTLKLVTAAAAQSVPYSQRCAPGKDHTSRRKSAKGKKCGHVGSSGSSGTSGKQKIIKFHEYKVAIVPLYITP